MIWCYTQCYKSMQAKSQHKNDRLSQRRNTQDANTHLQNIKQQLSRDQKSKNQTHHVPQPLNSPSYKKMPLHPGTAHQQPQIDPPSLSNSNASRPRNSSCVVAVDRVVQLHQRLKNLHLFYKTRIEQEKARTAQRNEVFIGIIQEMQRSHTQKLAQLKKMLEDSHNQKKDVGLVDERMNDIKGSIDEILKQSSDLKQGNQRLQRDIEEKQQVLKQKEEELCKLKEEVMESRNQLESFERLNLRENKRSKEIVGMIEKTAINFHHKHNL